MYLFTFFHAYTVDGKTFDSITVYLICKFKVVKEFTCTVQKLKLKLNRDENIYFL